MVANSQELMAAMKSLNESLVALAQDNKGFGGLPGMKSAEGVGEEKRYGPPPFFGPSTIFKSSDSAGGQPSIIETLSIVRANLAAAVTLVDSALASTKGLHGSCTVGWR